MPGVLVNGAANKEKESEPAIKRKKVAVVDNGKPARRNQRKSRLFAPFRTVGLVSPTDVPFTTLPLGKTTFQITTSVGRSLQTFDVRRGLNLVFLTRPQTPENITATSAWRDQTLAAWSGKGPKAARGIWVFKRGKKVDELQMPKGSTEKIVQLLVFGSWIVACSATQVHVWQSATLEHYTSLSSPFLTPGASGIKLSGTVCTMPTLLNKIFVGRTDGAVELWNLSTGKMLYTFLPAIEDSGPVTVLQPTPALSLLAIGYASGLVIVHDIRKDKEVMRFTASSSRKIPVTSISFRTDGSGAGEDGQKDGVMATACKNSGDVTFWDLNSGGRKLGVLRGAHNPPSSGQVKVAGGISKIEFLPGQAVLMTSGLDNSLKSWIFDAMPFSPIPRILHSRSGHAAPVSSLQFIPTEAEGADSLGKWLLSSSQDRSLWGWSLRRDGQSTELSQGHIAKRFKNIGTDGNLKLEDLKAPQITCMACSLNRDGGIGAAPGATGIWGKGGQSKKNPDATVTGMTGWESVITGHAGDKRARTWFWGRKRAGRWAFDTGDQTEVKSVAISPCGTFALIGSAAGGIDMFNLQSGVHRQRFPPKLRPEQAKRLRLAELEAEEEDSAEGKKFARGQGKHTKAVTGLAVDSLNKAVISCGEDGKVKFWDFATGLLLHELDWFPVATGTGLRYHRPSDLIALSCDDSTIRLIDIETKKLVRELHGSGGQIIDYTFSNDGRWIIAAFSDSVLRVWDLPTGHLIDAIRFRSKFTAIAFSTTGEYLATAQEDSVGVHIWANRTLFTHVPTRRISDTEIVEIDLPTVSGEGGESIIATANEDEDAEDQEELITEGAALSIDQLSEDMLTLSLVPRPRWQNLLHLDLIRQRNKPKEPPKPPEKAPFFLPSLNPTSTSAASNDATLAAVAAPAAPTPSSSRITTTTQPSLRTNNASNDFNSHLQIAIRTHDPMALLDHLSTLNPSAADVAIRSLDPAAPYTELVTFIDALTARLRQKRDYELILVWMKVLLRCHGTVVAEAQDSEGGAELRKSLQGWRQEERREAGRLDGLLGFSRGVVGWLRGPG